MENSNKRYAYKKTGYFEGVVGEITGMGWEGNIDYCTLTYTFGCSTIARLDDIVYCVKTPDGWEKEDGSNE